MDDEEEVDLHEGMPVSNEEGEKLGTLSALLIPDDEEDAEFFLVSTSAGDRLVPFDAVVGVGDGALVIDVTSAILPRYPAVKSGDDPSDDDVEAAYTLYDETGRYAGDEDDDE